MNNRSPLRRAALVLALLVLEAIVTGVAASATTSGVHKQLTGHWRRGGAVMDIDPLGLGGIGRGRERFGLVFEPLGSHRLGISGAPSCSGTGIYRWRVANRKLKLTTIHDVCKSRVGWLAGTWRRTS
jgi:hypothetical protein